MKYTIFAGVNGAGKSSLYSIFKSELDLGARINTDEIVGKNWRDEKLQIHAARKAIEIRNFCFENQIRLNQETTLTGKTMLKSIEKAKEPSTAESEEKSYEQQTLFPSTNMY